MVECVVTAGQSRAEKSLYQGVVHLKLSISKILLFHLVIQCAQWDTYCNRVRGETDSGCVAARGHWNMPGLEIFIVSGHRELPSAVCERCAERAEQADSVWSREFSPRSVHTNWTSSVFQSCSSCKHRQPTLLDWQRIHQLRAVYSAHHKLYVI